MTLPEHAICSLLITQFGVHQRFGKRGVVLVTAAGIAPDLDTAAKLISDAHFWALHHALGHSLISILVIATATTLIGRFALGLRQTAWLFAWCLITASAHCLTDALYWWGIQPLWPFSPHEICFDILEYLDLIVLAIWLMSAYCLYKYDSSRRVATAGLTVFAAYVALRFVLPPPGGAFHFIAGGWMYAAPQGTPVLDWW